MTARKSKYPYPDPLRGIDVSGTLSINEAAQRLGVSREFIRRAIKQEKLPAYIPGGKDGLHSGRLGYRIRAEDLRDWFFGR